MPMNTDQSTKHGNLGSAGSLLQTAIDAYTAKALALATAQTQFDSAKTQLDNALTGFNTSDALFEAAFPLPAGYIPPTP
jgi:hypothetical protein